MSREDELKAYISALKASYMELSKNEAVMQDLRSFCSLAIPTDMSGKIPNLDVSKVMVATGRASVLERIDYFINTPEAQIVKQYLGA